MDASPLGLVATRERVHEQEERQRAFFVNRRSQQRPDGGQRRAAALPADGTQRGHLDADEDVSFAVLAGPGLEEPLQDGDARGIGFRPQLFSNGGRGGSGRCHRSYDSRRADADWRTMNFCGLAQKSARSSVRLDAPP